MKRIHLLGALAGLVLLLPLVASGAKSFPDRIGLPDGFQPEGIAIGPGHTFYVGSIPTGRVWRGDLRTGEGAVLVPDRGRQATGVDVDHRRRLFVAGGPTGDGYVYNARTGADIASYDFADTGTFVKTSSSPAGLPGSPTRSGRSSTGSRSRRTACSAARRRSR
jgi:hypothetical protein